RDTHYHPKAVRKGLSDGFGTLLHRSKQAPSRRRAVEPAGLDYRRPRYFCATPRNRKDHDRGLISDPPGPRKAARTGGRGSVPAATASRGRRMPEMSVSVADGSRSASAAARSTTR